jgi:large subunit ribosomal protein L10
VRREEKVKYVESLQAELSNAQVVVKTRFQGIGVESLNQLRSELRASGASYRVVKNTLLRLAVRDTDLAPLADDLKGPIALAYSTTNAVDTAKALKTFSKTQKLLLIDGGMLSGKTLSAEDVDALAKLPSLDQLRGQFLSLLQAVPQKFLRVLQAPSRDLVGVLEARRHQLDEE